MHVYTVKMTVIHMKYYLFLFLTVSDALLFTSASDLRRDDETCAMQSSPLTASEDGGRLFDFLSGGLKRLFWSYNWHGYESRVQSDSCIKSIVQVQRKLAQGCTKAYSMVDASSSTAAGFLTGSFSSLGDFDQCLSIKMQSAIEGNYCLLEFSLRNESNFPRNAVDGHLRSIMPLLGFFLPRMSLCLPHQCSSDQVLALTRHVLTDYPLQATDKISCQTNRSATRARLSAAQVASLTFISIMFTLCLIASLMKYLVPDIECTFTKIFSLQYHWRQLLYRSSSECSRHRGIDKLKLIFSLMFISMHAIGGTDNPFSPLVLSNMVRALEDASKPEFQFLFSENLAEVMFTLTGYVTVTSIVTFTSKMNDKKSALKVILSFMSSKWLRTAPLVFALLALEFIWPLMSTGPLYPEASTWVVNNCHKYWWSNVLMIANWFPSIEKCCPQLFHSCVDFQLTLIAIALLLILNKSTKAGVFTAFTLSTLSMAKLYQNALRYSVIPNYVSNGATIEQRMLFIDQIHLPTYAHLPAYVLGVLCAFKSITRKTIFIPPLVAKMASYTCFFLSLAAAFAPALHNSFHVLTQPFIPAYIVLQKLLYIAVLLPILLPCRSSKGQSVKQPTDDCAQEQFDLLGCLSKLTFCSYLINFYVIRYDFMVARIPFEHGIHSANKRFVFSVLNTYLASFMFYLIFAGPFEEMRKLFITRMFFASKQTKQVQ